MKQNIDRRAFLKDLSLLAGTGVLLGSSPWFNVFASPVNGKKINVGVIGTGSRGQYLIECMNQVEAINITAICDDYKPSIELGIAKCQSAPEVYSDYRLLLEDKNIQAVVIATPLHLHAQMTIDSIDAGKHVFCEKAMAITIEECKAMVEKSLRDKKILQIGQQRMFHPRYLKALELVRGGRIGNITQVRAFWHRNNDWRRTLPNASLERKINWRLYRDYSRGLMTELATHQIQVSNWFTQMVPDYVMGSGSINYWKDGREVYDNVNLVYHYPNGTHLIYDSMISNIHYGLEEQIMGNRGTIEPELGKIYSESPPPAPGIVQLISDIEKGIFSSLPIGGASWIPDHSLDKTGSPLFDEKYKDENILQFEGFAQSIMKNERLEEHLEQAYYASVLSLMGDEAMQKNEIIKWKQEFNFPEI